MNFSPALARFLSELIQAGSVPKSRVSKGVQSDIQGLLDSEVLVVVGKAGGLRYEVVNENALKDVAQKWFPSGLQAATTTPHSRAEAVISRRDAKAAKRADTEAVLLRGAPETMLRCNQGTLELGHWTEKAGYAAVELNTDRRWHFLGIVVTVENLETFRQVEKVVPSMEMAVYTAGRASDRMLAWLGDLARAGCRILHWGDYDPVGMDEFLRLMRACDNQAELVVPADLENLFRRFGKADLVRDNTALLKKLRGSKHPDVASVVELMDRFGCGLEQEVLLIEELD